MENFTNNWVFVVHCEHQKIMSAKINVCLGKEDTSPNQKSEVNVWFKMFLLTWKENSDAESLKRKGNEM